MSVSAWKVHFPILLPALAWIVTGCIPPRPPPPSPAEIVQKLSDVVLQPEVTCAELREDFGVQYLPLADTPADAGISYEEHSVSTADGQVLRVWYMPGTARRGTVIVSPGAFGPVPCYLFTAKLLADNGWSVVMYDYEGFGGSSGTPTLKGLRPDLSAVLDWARARTGAPQVSLLGMSLGSIASVAVAVDRPEAVNAVVLDSPVALAQEIERFGELIDARADVIVAALDPWLVSEDIIDQMRQPLLVFLQENDVVTPPSSVELLYERAGGPKEIVRFTGLEHAAAQFQDTEEYTARLEQFLTRVWQP